MRGDSLRDFYAKTLAVLGLGLLAGAGAAVDYWPVGSPLPSVKSVRLPAPDVPLLAQNFDRKIPAPVQERRVFVRGTIHAKNVGTAKFLIVPVQPAPRNGSVTAPVPDVALSVSDDQSVLLGSSVPFFADYVVADYLVTSAAAVSPSATQESGFIGGALKKTKESIVRTGAVTGSTIAATGSTIADAFKGFFKKVTPF